MLLIAVGAIGIEDVDLALELAEVDHIRCIPGIFLISAANQHAGFCPLCHGLTEIDRVAIVPAGIVAADGAGQEHDEAHPSGQPLEQGQGGAVDPAGANLHGPGCTMGHEVQGIPFVTRGQDFGRPAQDVGDRMGDIDRPGVKGAWRAQGRGRRRMRIVEPWIVNHHLSSAREIHGHTPAGTPSGLDIIPQCIDLSVIADTDLGEIGPPLVVL